MNHNSKAAERYMQSVRETVADSIPTTINCPSCECDVEPGELDEAISKLEQELTSLFADFLDDLYSEVKEAIGDAFDYQP